MSSLHILNPLKWLIKRGFCVLAALEKKFTQNHKHPLLLCTTRHKVRLALCIKERSWDTYHLFSSGYANSKEVLICNPLTARVETCSSTWWLLSLLHFSSRSLLVTNDRKIKEVLAPSWVWENAFGYTKTIHALSIGRTFTFLPWNN